MRSMTEGLSVRVSIYFKIAVISPLPIPFFKLSYPLRCFAPPPLMVRGDRKSACDVSPFQKGDVKKRVLHRRPKIKNLPSSNPWRLFSRKNPAAAIAAAEKLFAGFAFIWGADGLIGFVSAAPCRCRRRPPALPLPPARPCYSPLRCCVSGSSPPPRIRSPAAARTRSPAHG